MKLIADKALGDEPIGIDPESTLPVYLKSGRFGPYVRLGDQEEGSKERPKMVSLLKDMKMEDVDLPMALRLLTLPRTLGVDENGDDVIARLGRYGPYITRLKDSRSLKDEDNLLEIGLPRALVLLAEPRVARGRQQPKVLHTYGELEELDGLELKILDGRYGPYVTDGEFNGSLPKDEADKPTEFSLARALDVLAAAKERKGRKKKAKKKTKKKATKKKATKKKVTKKKAAKKKATKKKATSKKKASADGSEESGE
jgi:DNA topoisomerase-1